jgi:hypothetical protein
MMTWRRTHRSGAVQFRPARQPLLAARAVSAAPDQIDDITLADVGRRYGIRNVAGTGHLTRTDGARSLGSASDAYHAGEGTDDAQAGEPDGQ